MLQKYYMRVCTRINLGKAVFRRYEKIKLLKKFNCEMFIFNFYFYDISLKPHIKSHVFFWFLIKYIQ